MEPRDVVLVVFPGLQGLDLIGPAEVFAAANDEAGRPVYRLRVRIETARRLLEDADDGVESIATAAGFGTAETMRRTFLRLLRTNPTEYRRRFRAA